MIVGSRKSTAIRDLYQKRSNKAIESALSEIKKSDIAPFVQNIYLYGSCARNEQTYGSDVDLLIELTPAFDTVSRKSSRISELRGRLKDIGESITEVEAKLVIGDKWKSDDSLFYRNIRREGKKLW